MMPTRRQFLMGATGVTALVAGATITSGATLSAAQAECADMHARLSETYRALSRSIDFATTNAISMAMDIACPCCGQPLFDFLG